MAIVFPDSPITLTHVAYGNDNAVVRLSLHGTRILTHCVDCSDHPGAILTNGRTCPEPDCQEYQPFDPIDIDVTDVFAKHKLREQLAKLDTTPEVLEYSLSRIVHTVRMFTNQVMSGRVPQPIAFVAPRSASATDDAAQLTGMLFADQDSTGMLF